MVVVVAGSVVALLLSASGLEALRFSAAAIVAFRIVVAVVFATLAALWLWRPLKRQVSDAQVALYLRSPTRAWKPPSSARSGRATPKQPATRRIRTRSSTAWWNRRSRNATRSITPTIERKRLRQHLATLAGVGVAATLLVVFGPAFLRNGLSALLIVYGASRPRRRTIDVTPGTTTVPRGRTGNQGEAVRLQVDRR